MKKLVTAACALAAGMAMADVTSGNTVGYDNSLTTVRGYNFFAVPFNTIGDGNTADIQLIQLEDETGQFEVGNGEEAFSFWQGSPSVIGGSEYMYWVYPDSGPNGEDVYQWEDENGDSDFSIDPGQGFVLECVGGLTVKFAGQVSDTPATQTTVRGYNFYGNPFAAPISIQAIQIADESGAFEPGNGEEAFSFWQGSPSVVADSEYMYWVYPDAGPNGEDVYQWEDENGNSDFTINPGQGFVLECVGGLTVTITSPYTL